MQVNHIYHGDALEVLRTLPDESVHCIVTSPPYLEADGFDFDGLRYWTQELYRLSVSGGLLFLNFGHLAENKMRPFYVAASCEMAGFELNDTITWEKNHYTPCQSPKRLNNLTEFIFMFFKPPMPDLDRLAVGVPYKDKQTAKRYGKGRDLRCGGNIWRINIPTITKRSDRPHPHAFPIELPERCIKLAGCANRTPRRMILDPFCGSGTTCAAAELLGCDWIGIEHNAEYAEFAAGRLAMSRCDTPAMR